jgi:hypothetical protein
MRDDLSRLLREDYANFRMGLLCVCRGKLPRQLNALSAVSALSKIFRHSLVEGFHHFCLGRLA